MNNFLGGIWNRGGLPPAETVGEDWGWVGERSELFLRGAPVAGRLFLWDSLAVFLRGHARPRGSSTPLDLERIAEDIRCRYLEQGILAVDDLEGSFTITLLDGQAGRVILYRNLIGSGFTYYRASRDGFLFGGNLAELIDLAGGETTPAKDVLPAFFLFRCVPGRDTLASDFYRLLPGEQVTWDERGLVREQRQTFADLRGDLVRPEEAMDLIESTLAMVLRDCADHRPGAANLLSGGVDSSYIQAIWNRTAHRGNALPLSYSISVDHPMTWLDTDYAMTASQALGTRHVLVPADGPYEQYLADTLARTGEPLNHVQSAYFGHLARAMQRDGIRAGLCGEGADSLFGLGLTNQFHNAQILGSLLPLSILRSLAGGISGMLGWDKLAYTCQLANRRDDETWREHPINRVATFTEFPLVEACFGRAAHAALADRRDLLTTLEVGEDRLDRMHATGFLGEAMDSAGLWATLFQSSGVDLLCPFLDSRMLRLALNLPAEIRYPFRRPKGTLRNALARRAPANLARRVKLGFGQPVFEWLAPGGQLRQRVEAIGLHAFLEPAVLASARQKPGWFLYSLLVYDTWHRTFVERGSSSVQQRPNPALVS